MRIQSSLTLSAFMSTAGTSFAERPMSADDPRPATSFRSRVVRRFAKSVVALPYPASGAIRPPVEDRLASSRDQPERSACSGVSGRRGRPEIPRRLPCRRLERIHYGQDCSWLGTTSCNSATTPASQISHPASSCSSTRRVSFECRATVCATAGRRPSTYSSPEQQTEGFVVCATRSRLGDRSTRESPRHSVLARSIPRLRVPRT